MIYCLSGTPLFNSKLVECYNDVTLVKFFKKKSKAVKNWRSRAMIIDVSKTRVMFIRSNDLGNSAETENDQDQMDDETGPQPLNIDKSEYQPLF